MSFIIFIMPRRLYSLELIGHIILLGKVYHLLARTLSTGLIMIDSILIKCNYFSQANPKDRVCLYWGIWTRRRNRSAIQRGPTRETRMNNRCSWLKWTQYLLWKVGDDLELTLLKRPVGNFFKVIYWYILIRIRTNVSFGSNKSLS